MLPYMSNLTQQTIATMPPSQADNDRKERMREAWRAYRGELQDPLKIEANQPNDNVRVNRCEPIVNKGVSFLFGQILSIEDTVESHDTDSSAETPMQDFINGLWGDDDERMTLLSQMAINGAVCGQCFAKIIPPSVTQKYPRIVILDPMLIRLVTDPDDCTAIIAYIIEYNTGSTGVVKRQIISRVELQASLNDVTTDDINEVWQIANYTRKGQGGSWYQVGDIEDWEWPFPPIFCCQNLPNPNEPWGMPDLTPDLIGINKVLNFVLSNMSRIIKYHGHPITYATGLSASQISISVDDLLCLPSPDSKINKIAAMENFTGLLSVVTDLRSDMDEQSRVPSVALGRLVDLPKGNISGVALQLLFQPLIEKTVQKQRLYGCMIRAVTRAAMTICGLIDIKQYEDYKIKIHWANLLPVDDLAAAQTSLLWKQMGVSSATLLQSAGFNADDEAAKSQVEAAQQVQNYSQGTGLAPNINPIQLPQSATAQQKAVGEA